VRNGRPERPLVSLQITRDLIVFWNLLFKSGATLLLSANNQPTSGMEPGVHMLADGAAICGALRHTARNRADKVAEFDRNFGRRMDRGVWNDLQHHAPADPSPGQSVIGVRSRGWRIILSYRTTLQAYTARPSGHAMVEAVDGPILLFNPFQEDIRGPVGLLEKRSADATTKATLARRSGRPRGAIRPASPPVRQLNVRPSSICRHFSGRLCHVATALRMAHNVLGSMPGACRNRSGTTPRRSRKI